MQRYKVIVTWEAVYDIAEIADYIEAQFGIARADRFQEEIKERLDKLEILGGIFGKTYLCYRGYSIYKNPFPPSIIFYIIIESEKEIHVLRVLREERDWESILTRQRDYTYSEPTINQNSSPSFSVQKYNPLSAD